MDTSLKASLVVAAVVVLASTVYIGHDARALIGKKDGVTQEPVPQLKKDQKIKDKPGQLVQYAYTVKGIPAPKGAEFTPDGKEIWVTSLLNKKYGVTVLDAKSGEKRANINLKNGGGVEIIFSKDGARAYVSQMETGQVFEIDTATKKISRTIKTGSSWTKVMVISPDGHKMYASNWTGNTVSEIDLVTGKLLRKIPTVRTPRGLYVTPDGTALYVAGYDRGEIQKIALATGKGKVIYKSGGAMRHIVADEATGVLYVSDMGKDVVWRLTLADDSVKKFIKTDANPNTIALTQDKKVLIISNRGRNHPSGNYYIPGLEWGSVQLFDTTDGKMLDGLVGGNQPTALAIAPDGMSFVFSDFLDNAIKVSVLPAYGELVAGKGGRSALYKKELRKR